MILIKKNIIIPITAVLLSAAVVFGLASCSSKKETTATIPGDTVVATVNGENITENEFQYFRNRIKSTVMNDILEERSETYYAGFWDDVTDDTSPNDVLDQKALDECVRAKIQLVLMREHGIYSDISYEGLQKKAEDFNTSNAAAQNVVGIKSIQMSSFYTYYISNGVIELKNQLETGDLKPDAADITELAGEMASQAGTGKAADYYKAASRQLTYESYDKYMNKLFADAQVKTIVSHQH